MNPNLVRVLLAIFMIAHAFIHVSLTYVPLPKAGEMHTPFWPTWTRTDTDPTWPLMKLGLPGQTVRVIGCVLWILAAGSFLLTGLGLFGIPGLNQIWSYSGWVGAITSLLMLVLFWHPWYIACVVINLAILAGLNFHFPKHLFS